MIEEKSASLHVVELKLNTRRGNTPGPREQSPATHRGPGSAGGGSGGGGGGLSAPRAMTPAGSDVIRGEIGASRNGGGGVGVAGVTTPPPPAEKFTTPSPNGPAATKSAMPTSRRYVTPC